MKRIIIIAAIAVILGTPNAAMAWLGAGAADLSLLFPTFNQPASKSPHPKKEPPQNSKPERGVNGPTPIIDLIKEQNKVIREQLKHAAEINRFIMEKTKISDTPTNYTSFFLKNPELLYSENKSENISTSFKKILQEEKLSNSISDARDSINQRIHDTAVIDKAISLRTFREAENRFDTISKLLNQIDKTNNLKDIAELQIRIKAKLVMIQNEAVKLQMVAHMRNAEQELISQQKYKRNMKILNSKNTAMPIIQSIR
ncbi:type IV secretion system protein VirB5 [Bartonella callosciuri]|uniref:Type IV secretion system protein VirB5 n=1 Tax=Bartonella callosciuri TaxID=686223 RepID=A0A840NNF6_9HYPH|nr:type IV secretion system protein [Bartonella callosciuri]MBB5074256.1 type IV secretion system protein VirB5 [Bartonella callosciuri]